MELLFVTVIGAAISLGVRYVVPGRQWHGLLLVPMVGAAATAAIWVICVWLGLTFDGGWIWVISIAAGTIAPLALSLVLPGRRAAADEELFERLASPSSR